MRICCFLAPPELGELGKPGSLARRLALGRPLALLCGLVRGIIRLIIVNCIRVAVPMAALATAMPHNANSAHMCVLGLIQEVRHCNHCRLT